MKNVGFSQDQETLMNALMEAMLVGYEPIERMAITVSMMTGRSMLASDVQEEMRSRGLAFFSSEDGKSLFEKTIAKYSISEQEQLRQVAVVKLPELIDWMLGGQMFAGGLDYEP